MKCRYTFHVVSRINLDPPVTFFHGGLKFTLRCDSGRFDQLIAEAIGITFEAYPTISHKPGSKIPSITIPDDPILKKVQAEVRAIQGALSLWGVHSIETHHPKIDWQPETAEEKEKTDVLGFARDRPERGKERPSVGQLDVIVRSFLGRERFQDHELPLEFYRRGLADMYDGHYIEAIYDFYFFLEYLFSDGKSDRNGTLASFLAAPELVAAVAAAQKNPMGEILENRSWKKSFDDRYASAKPEELLKQIIGLRGFLHHQTLKRKKNWNPSLHDDYRVDAHFLNRVCHEVAMRLVCDVLFDAGQMEEFTKTKVCSLDGTVIEWTPIDRKRNREGMVARERKGCKMGR